MGCHTWFSVPYLTDKQDIIKTAQLVLNSDTSISDGHRKMYQFAIDNELIEPVCEIASNAKCMYYAEYPWKLYMDIRDFTVHQYNIINNTNYNKFDVDIYDNTEIIESYSDEPRIGGYPDRIVRSYDDMLNFMSSGFDDHDGEHYDFYYETEKYEHIMSGIKRFFDKHPDGIITFD